MQGLSCLPRLVRRLSGWSSVSLSTSWGTGCLTKLEGERIFHPHPSPLPQGGQLIEFQFNQSVASGMVWVSQGSSRTEGWRLRSAVSTNSVMIR